MTSTTAPENFGVSFPTRDGNGRPTLITLPGKRTLATSYDLVGNLLSVTPPSKPTHGFVTTPTNRLASYAPPDLGFSPKNTEYTYDDDDLILLAAHPGTPVTYAYDPLGRTKQRTAAVSTSFDYDALGRLQTIATSDGVTLTNTYDGTLLTQQAINGPFSHAINTTYDNFLRVSSMDVDGANAVTYTRDGDGYVTGVGGLTLNWSTNGLLTSTNIGAIADSFTYNEYGEIIGYSVSGSATGYSVTYARDSAGRIHDKTETIGGVSHSFRYEYDEAGRLWQVYVDGASTPTRQWTYDGNGNRDGGTYDNQDRLTAYAGSTYTYGPNGELLTKTVSGITYTYNYDAHGNLRQVQAPAGTINYVIDGNNKRVGKRYGSLLIQGILYEGARIVAELDGGGTIVSRFIYATGSHSPDLMLKGTSTFRFVKDQLGSPRLIVNTATGAVAQRLEYDEWGVVTADTNPGFQPFGFAGGLWDRDTNLVRFGERDYDPTSGRWTTKDALRFEGGRDFFPNEEILLEPNLYAYVYNNPINWTDPSGTGPLEFFPCLWKGGTFKQCFEEERERFRHGPLGDIGGSAPPGDIGGSAPPGYRHPDPPVPPPPPNPARCKNVPRGPLRVNCCIFELELSTGPGDICISKDAQDRLKKCLDP
jgi:RHS repeat-associated protein